MPAMGEAEARRLVAGLDVLRIDYGARPPRLMWESDAGWVPVSGTCGSGVPGFAE